MGSWKEIGKLNDDLDSIIDFEWENNTNYRLFMDYDFRNSPSEFKNVYYFHLNEAQIDYNYNFLLFQINNIDFQVNINVNNMPFKNSSSINLEFLSENKKGNLFKLEKEIN